MDQSSLRTAGDGLLGQRLARRSLFALAGAVGVSGIAGTVVAERAGAAPTSLIMDGPYPVYRVILGEDTDASTALPQPFTSSDLPAHIPHSTACVDGRVVPVDVPRRVLAAVHYPYRPGSRGLGLASGNFPIVLFGHGLRFQELACVATNPIARDFTMLDGLMSHIASYGFVTVVPDMSWLPGDVTAQDLDMAISLRARLLLAYYQRMVALNGSLFGGQLDLGRVMFAGHSTGGGAAAEAGRMIQSVINIKVAYAMLAPYFRNGPARPYVGLDTRGLFVMHGTLDDLAPDALSAYAFAGKPKTHVTLPGGNHFGYTELCEPDLSSCDLGAPGKIARFTQQRTASSYMVAMLRYWLLNDSSMWPYLTGVKQIEGLDVFGAPDLPVMAEGYPLILANP